MQDRKIHYKMYKAGKHWIFAAIAVVSLGIGTSEVRADDVNTVKTDSTEVSVKAANIESSSSNAETTVTQTDSTSIKVGGSTSAEKAKQVESSSTKVNTDSSSINKDNVNDSK